MSLTSHVRVYCCKYNLSSMTTMRWWKWGACCWTWHVVCGAATSQFLPIPVPDVHVSTICTAALSRRQKLCAARGHDGRFIACRVIKFLGHTPYHPYADAHCNMHTNACTDAHAGIQMGLHHHEAQWNMNIIICSGWLCSPPLHQPSLFLIYFYSHEFIILQMHMLFI